MKRENEEVGFQELVKNAVENMPEPDEIDFSKEVKNNEANYLIVEDLAHGHSVKHSV